MILSAPCLVVKATPPCLATLFKILLAPYEDDGAFGAGPDRQR